MENSIQKPRLIKMTGELYLCLDAAIGALLADFDKKGHNKVESSPKPDEGKLDLDAAKIHQKFAALELYPSNLFYLLLELLPPEDLVAYGIDYTKNYEDYMGKPEHPSDQKADRRIPQGVEIPLEYLFSLGKYLESHILESFQKTETTQPNKSLKYLKKCWLTLDDVGNKIRVIPDGMVIMSGLKNRNPQHVPKASDSTQMFLEVKVLSYPLLRTGGLDYSQTHEASRGQFLQRLVSIGLLTPVHTLNLTHPWAIQAVAYALLDGRVGEKIAQVIVLSVEGLLGICFEVDKNMEEAFRKMLLSVHSRLESAKKATSKASLDLKVQILTKLAKIEQAKQPTLDLDSMLTPKNQMKVAA